MICKRWISVLGLIVFAAAWTGCVTHPPKQEPCVDDEIRVGDRLRISLLDIPDPELEKEFDVRTDGTVNLQLLGPVKAAGKKFAQFERDLQAAYITNNFYTRITVLVKSDVRFYTVAGEVKGAQRQVYTGPTTVLRAIATCGDFTEFADRRNVQITRAGGKKETVDCKKAQHDPGWDLTICPGDYIFVPRGIW